MDYLRDIVVVSFVFSLLFLEVLAAEKETVELKKIVVTPATRPESILYEPLSTTLFDRKTIDERLFTSVQDLADAVPNLNFADSGMRSFSDVINIRGLTNIPFGNNPSVLLYVDDVPYGGPYTYANQLFGIESVEVLRGPQNASFGANAYGGVINVKSRQPENEWVSQVSFGGGNYDYWAGNGYTSGALIPDKLYFTLGGAYAERDGFLKNNFLGSRPDDQQQISARASLKWTPTKNWDLRFSASVDDFRDGAPRLVPLTDASLTVPLNDVTFETNAGLNGKIDQTIDSQSLRIAYQGDEYEIVSVTSRRNWQLDPLLADTDLSPEPIAELEFREDQEQWNEEFRIRPTNPHAMWDWSIGFFFSTSELDAFRRFTFFGVDDSRQWLLDENSYALFGQLSFNPVDQLRLHAGLRFDYIEKNFNWTLLAPQINAPNEYQSDYFFVSPKIAADYALSDHASVYASTALAYKPGGFRPFNDEHSSSEFDSERSWANEIGIKWVSERTRAKLALFYYRIHDYQVDRFLNPFDFIIVNADETESSGIEFELNTVLWEGLSVETAFGYNKIEFIKHSDPITGTDFKGNKVPFVPEFNLMLAAEYRHPFGFYTRAEGVWTGETYFDQHNTKLFSEGEYVVFNARIGFEHKRFAVYAYGNNLTNSKYFSFKFPSAFAGTPGVPRTYGIKLNLKF